jgi:hypothetical protein
MPTLLAPQFVSFDENGDFVDRSELESALASAMPTDIFVFSHGWNNSFADASAIYTALIEQMEAVADARPAVRPEPYRPLALGVIWPSKAWDEEAALESTAPNRGSSLADAVYDILSPQRASPAGFRHDVLRLQQFIVKERLNAAEAAEFRELLRRHADRPTLPEDESIFEPEAPAGGLEGATSSDFSVRDVFRTFTYWQMKKRAGIVGQHGVRAAVAAAQQRFPTVRVHLIGHSFGCKVVLACVAGPGARLPRPVQTVILLQGAVSHEALANRVSGTSSPGGYHAALERERVDGPIVATYSRLDKACNQSYPLGSRLGGQVGELEGLFDRFRALGAVGAMGIENDLNNRVAMQDVNGRYGILGRGVWSVDGGTPPANYITGHSEIRSPQVAWLIWSAVRRLDLD